MGCASSRNNLPSSPPSGHFHNSENSSREFLPGPLWEYVNVEQSDSGESGKLSSIPATSFQLGFGLGLRNSVRRHVEGEQAAAGWPPWLSAVAAEALHGWVPLRSESFEKLEKIGQGTYSSVLKARDLDTGKLVALKKVRFDTYDPESVNFMAREILILRKLNHPNIIKLEGIITARKSSTLCLVFEYMEHDLLGLSSSPDIKFSESQVKCYMHQLLSGLEHCHSHGVMHRDIKCANILLNNEGILKVADFGLASFCKRIGQRQPLTSRVVTLWYRPPELLLGSTDYDATVDLWSVGCVFAELILRKPIFPGRTEVEQMHKIFKLCGSPPDEFWRKLKLPHSAGFKPQNPYANCLHDTFNYLPESAFRLLKTFLALEPYKRGNAKSALESEYFKSKPYACEPSSFPKYSPHKEIDAKNRKESYKRPSIMHRRGQSNLPSKFTARRKDRLTKYLSVDENDGSRLSLDLKQMPTVNLQMEDCRLSGPLSSTNVSGLLWAKKPKEKHSSNKSCSKSNSFGNVLWSKNTLDNHDFVNGFANNNHQDLNKDRYRRDTESSKHRNVGAVDFSSHLRRG